MDYLTNYYKNLSESLQEKVNYLQKLVEAQDSILLDKDKMREKKFEKSMDAVFGDEEVLKKLQQQSEFEASVMGKEENPEQQMPQLARADAQRLAMAALNKMSQTKPATAADAEMYKQKEMQKVADRWAKAAGTLAAEKEKSTKAQGRPMTMEKPE